MSNVKIILISGKAQNGKDTLAKFMKQELEKQGKKVVIDHFAKYIKSYCYQMGWNNEKDEYWRTKLQLLGTDVIKEELNYKAFHAKRLSEDIQILNRVFDIEYFIIPDTRFRDEVHTLQAMFPDNVTTIRVVREGCTGGLTEEQLQHRSEVDLDDFYFDITVPNILGLDWLENTAREIIKGDLI